MTIRLTLPQVLQKGKPAALTFIYEGKLTGSEESPDRVSSLLRSTPILPI